MIGLERFIEWRISRRLTAALEANADDAEALSQLRWFGEHLRPVLRRVMRERPAARRALVRFLGTYVHDVWRRTAPRRAGLPTPATVVIEPTDRCNLSCEGCYASSGRRGNDLPFASLVAIVEQTVEMGATLITLSGGEPFLRERTDQAITRLARRFPNHGFLVYTNGTLIDAAIAARLGDLGNVFPAISVEGFEGETDARRGHGVFEGNRKVRRMLARRGVMTGFSATVTSQNAETIASDAFIDQRLAEGDLFGWFFLFQPIGRFPRADWMVNAAQRLSLRAAVRRWRESERPIFLGDFWNDGPLVGGCLAAGRYYFHIRANGEISPCVFAPVACGNIHAILSGHSPYGSLKDFIDRHPLLLAFRAGQAALRDRARPCVLIDHPEIFRRLAGLPDCQAAANMPEGYLDGEIARALDLRAEDFRRAVAIPCPLSTA